MWDGPDLPLWQTLSFSSVVLFALYACLTSGRTSKQEGIAFGRLAAWTFLFLLTCMLVSRFNVSDHHLIALIPIAAVLVAIAARDSYRRWPKARYLVGAIAVLYLGSAMQWNLAAARQIRSTGGVRLWSNAIDSVSGYLQRNHSERTVKILDWGFQHSLFVLSNSRIASTELFWGASVERSGSGKLWRDEISPGDIYVLHLKGLVLFPEATEGFSRALAASAHSLRRTQFREKGGAPYAEVVEVLIPRKYIRMSSLRVSTRHIDNFPRKFFWGLTFKGTNINLVTSGPFRYRAEDNYEENAVDRYLGRCSAGRASYIAHCDHY